MTLLSRVVWSEGMHLAQHHFQAQSRYFETLADFALAQVFFRPYGLVAYGLDAEALLNGTVALTHARGRMPDGLPFHFPEDPPPPPLDVRELFSPTNDSQIVYLSIPAFRPNQPNCALEANGVAAVRYTLEQEALPDETTGQDEKPVSLARKNFRLTLDPAAEDVATLPLACVRRDGAGHFVYDPDFVPPCLQIGASERLLELLARLVEMLEMKAAARIAERQSMRGNLAEYAAGEVAGFWLSHTVHASLAPLRHLLQTRSAHPEVLFLELSRLAGALCTFSLTAHPRDLPAYDHDDLGRCFDLLDRHIRQNLDVIVPTQFVSIPLRQTDQYLFSGSVPDARCFGASHWFLAVRSSVAGSEVAVRVPRLVKICSAKFIVRLVKEGLPGLALSHVAAPPSALSPRLGTEYFRLEKSTTNPCWKSIVDSQQVGVYVPAAIADAELELAVVLET